MATVSALFLQDARQLWDAGSQDEAIQLLKEGLQIYPEYVTAYVVLAQFYKEQHRLEEAAAIADAARQRFPRDPQVLSLYQEILVARLADHAQAEEATIESFAEPTPAPTSTEEASSEPESATQQLSEPEEATEEALPKEEIISEAPPDISEPFSTTPVESQAVGTVQADDAGMDTTTAASTASLEAGRETELGASEPPLPVESEASSAESSLLLTTPAASLEETAVDTASTEEPSPQETLSSEIPAQPGDTSPEPETSQPSEALAVSEATVPLETSDADAGTSHTESPPATITSPEITESESEPAPLTLDDRKHVAEDLAASEATTEDLPAAHGIASPSSAEINDLSLIPELLGAEEITDTDTSTPPVAANGPDTETEVLSESIAEQETELPSTTEATGSDHLLPGPFQLITEHPGDPDEKLRRYNSRYIRLIPGLEFSSLGMVESPSLPLHSTEHTVPAPPPFPSELSFHSPLTPPSSLETMPEMATDQEIAPILTPLETLARKLNQIRQEEPPSPSMPASEEPPSPSPERSSDVPPIATDTMAQILVQQGRFAEAIQTYQKLQQQYPEKAAAYEQKIEELRQKLQRSS